MKPTMIRAPGCRLAGLAAIVAASAFTACGSDSTSADTTGSQPWLTIDPTWSSLYDGYFGPSGVASCTKGAGCHASEGDAGAMASNFICADKDGCYASLTGAANLIRSQDVANPADTPFLKKLRQTTGNGKMPSASKFVFQPEDVDVITTWIAMGANDD